MNIPIFQIDAFTDKLFGGNSAAVCPLEYWLPDTLMQKIAEENNLAETAFIVEENEGFRIRWFTPAVEVDLCGHATLAAGHVYFNHLAFSEEEITFNSRSGKLKVKKEGEFLTLDFPADQITRVESHPIINSQFGASVKEIWKGRTDYMVVLGSQKELEEIKPDFKILKLVEARGIIFTSEGNDCDFVSRFFAPQSGINEDPVTGSAHTTLSVYWSKRLGKKELTAIQVSPRMGYLKCKVNEERVEISGSCKTYMVGEVYLSEV